MERTHLPLQKVIWVHAYDGSSIASDAYSSCDGLQKEGRILTAKVFNPEFDAEHLKWMHTIVFKAKAFLLTQSPILS